MTVGATAGAGSGRTRTVATWALVGTIAFGALAFGSTEVWARSVLRLAAFLCLALAWWNVPRGTPLLPPAARRLLAPATLLLAVAVLQIVPLPRGVVRAVSPGAAAIYEETVPPDDSTYADWLAARAGSYGVTLDPDAETVALPRTERPTQTGRTLSLAPHSTWTAAWNWITCLALLAAAAALAVDPLARYRLAWGVTLTGGLLGLIGIAQKVSWNGLLLWFRDRPPGTLPVGPFVNPSHYAGFVEMTVLVAVGLALALVAPEGKRLDLAAVRTALFGDPWTFPRVALAAGCSVLGVAGILLSGSRGGFLALAAGLGVLVVSRRSRALVGILLVSIAMVGIAAGLVTWVGNEDAEVEGVPFVLSGADPSGALRLSTWGATLEIFRDHPAAGTGLGSFRWIFPMYQRAGEWKEWRHAHNDYVQLIAETGVPGLALLLWALYLSWRHVFRPVLGGSRAARWTSIGIAAAVLAMLVHTVVDFNLQIPSNAALFSVLLGMSAACAADARHEEEGT